jgi:dipeptidase E
MRLILNAGGMSGYPGGVSAVVAHFSECRRVALIPYAYVGDHAEAMRFTQDLFPEIPFVGVHTSDDPREVLSAADGIWVPGGNSFVLTDQLHARGLIDPVRRMAESGIPYAGSSAGANVAGPTICTTNDMPILRAPRALTSFGLVPFQINPHYLDADVMPPGFKGETRHRRIEEFLALNEVPVVGLREGSWLTVHGSHMRLDGGSSAVIFERDKPPTEAPPGSDLSWLLTVTPRFGTSTVAGLIL